MIIEWESAEGKAFAAELALRTELNNMQPLDDVAAWIWMKAIIC